MKSGSRHPDQIDLSLIAALQDDAKMPLAKLGERVGLSAQSVFERVRKLELAGVIAGYHAVIDARAVGLDVTAFIGVGIDSTRHLDAVETALTGAGEVLECHHVTGVHTLMLKVKTRNTATLEVLIRAIRGMEGVQRTETMIVLSTHSERTRLALPGCEGATEASSGGQPDVEQRDGNAAAAASGVEKRAKAGRNAAHRTNEDAARPTAPSAETATTAQEAHDGQH